MEFNAFRRYLSLITNEILVSEAGFGSSLGTGNHTDTCPSERPEQFPCDTRRAFHIFPYNGDSSKVFLCNRVAHVALGAFECKFFIQYFDRQIGICIADGKRRTASALRTANVVLFSELACDTMNTLMPFFANVLKIR